MRTATLTLFATTSAFQITSTCAQAIRKAPPTAYGFHQEVQKLKTIVQMLLGEIPDRATFRILYLRKTLAPYFELTQCQRALYFLFCV